MNLRVLILCLPLGTAQLGRNDRGQSADAQIDAVTDSGLADTAQSALSPAGMDAATVQGSLQSAQG